MTRPPPDRGPDDLLTMLRTEQARLGKAPVPPDIDSVAGYYRHLAAQPRLTALCLSGGGIRSASFCLGVLQALDREALLGQFDYLSSVSGGGYIAGWLHRWRNAGSDHDRRQPGADSRHLLAGAQPRIAALRATSSYLSPRLGPASSDLWAGIVLWMRNMVLNWLVLMPLLLACLQCPWIVADLVQALSDATTAGSTSRAWEQALLALPAMAALAYGLSHAAWYRRHAPPRLIRDAGSRTIVLHVLLPIVLGLLLLSGQGLIAGSIAHTRTDAGCGLVLYLSAELGAVIRRAAHMQAHTGAYLLRLWRRTRSRQLPCARNPVPVWLEILIWTVCGGVAGWIYGLLQGWIGASAPASTGFGICAGLLVLLVPNFLFTGLGSYSSNGEIDREWLARAATLFLFAAVLWGVVCAATLWLGPMRFRDMDRLYTGLTAGGSAGLAAALVGASRHTAATLARRVSTRLPVTWTLQAGCLAFACAVLVGSSRVEPALLGGVFLSGRPRWPAEASRAWAWLADDATLLAVLVGFAALVSLAVNINSFSLHGVYRNRLIRTFLGAARTERHPNRFTGFDPGDNRAMTDLWPHGRRSLFPVINATLNLVSGENPAWQERKAESFTITPLHCGAASVGYRPTRCYGGMRDGISLGTAITLSGAAVSPNMGYHSSALVGLVMTLFDVRLGAWLGNPSGSARVARGSGPRYAAFALLRELLGIANDRSGYVYLSDGGHFENLGIYEMLRRRCRLILAIDAGSDPKASFADLGGLVRKARIDFDTVIDFGVMPIAPRADPPRPGLDIAMASVTYPEGGPDPSLLIYLKPGLHGTEPIDVTAFANAHPDFPHETTANQFFLESRMESYRALGERAIERVMAAGPGQDSGSQSRPGTLDWLCACARQQLGQPV